MCITDVYCSTATKAAKATGTHDHDHGGRSLFQPFGSPVLGLFLDLHAAFALVPIGASLMLVYIAMCITDVYTKMRMGHVGSKAGSAAAPHWRFLGVVYPMYRKDDCI